MNALASLNQPLLATNGLDMNVSRLDFKRLKHKYTESSEAEMSAAEWDMTEQEYCRFLTLKRFYPSVALVPSKTVDAIWHAHILNTRAYREDCQQVFGRFIVSVRPTHLPVSVL